MAPRFDLLFILYSREFPCKIDLLANSRDIFISGVLKRFSTISPFEIALMCKCVGEEEIINMKKSMLTGLALLAASASYCQVWNCESYKISPYVWSDCPGSTFTSSSNGISSLTMQDDNVIGPVDKYANRHTAMFSNDGGATAYGSDTPADETYEVMFDCNVFSNSGIVGHRPRTVEAGPYIQTPAQDGWISDNQYILTNDGEVAAFGFPMVFYNAGGAQYSMGTTVKVGWRYFKKATDGLYYWQYHFNGTWGSPGLLDVVPNHDFGFDGLYTYDYNGQTWRPHFGIYLQVQNPAHPATNSGQAFNLGRIIINNLEINPFPGVKNQVAVQGVTLPYPVQIPVVVEVRNPGSTTPLESHNAMILKNGKLAFKPDVAIGKYDVAIKGLKQLRVVVKNVDIKNDAIVTMSNVSIKSGDCDNNNLVNTDDYLILNSSFDLFKGDSGYDARADLDYNDYVNTDDYLLLSNNFDEFGQD